MHAWVPRYADYNVKSWADRRLRRRSVPRQMPGCLGAAVLWLPREHLAPGVSRENLPALVEVLFENIRDIIEGTRRKVSPVVVNKVSRRAIL